MENTDIYGTRFLEGVIREKPQVYTFLRDRYFPEQLVFSEEKVRVDYDDGEGNLLAPFVVPEVGRVPFGRSGYETDELEPAYIAPSRPLDIKALKKRLPGEKPDSGKTPAEREGYYLVGDMDFLDKTISRREEWMCAQTMLDNACIMEHVGDRVNTKLTKKKTAYFYDHDGGGTNPGVFKPKEKWAVGTATKRGSWYNEVCRQIESLTAAGREVTDLLLGNDVADLVMNDPWVMAALDNRRFELGKLDPRWQPNGVTRLGALNFGGVILEIFNVRGTYQAPDKDGKLKTELYIPAAGAILAAPKTGKKRYGAVTQVEMDGNTYTRMGTRVPKRVVDVGTNMKETILTSAPVMAPKMKGQWRACRDVLTA